MNIEKIRSLISKIGIKAILILFATVLLLFLQTRIPEPENIAENSAVSQKHVEQVQAVILPEISDKGFEIHDYHEGDRLPVLSRQAKQALLNISRNTIIHYFKTGEKYQPQSIPIALTKNYDDINLYVTIRIAGKIIGCQGSRNPALSLAAVEATIAAIKDKRFGGKMKSGQVPLMNLEMNILGDAEKTGKTKINAEIEPGIHGVKLVRRSKTGEHRKPAFFKDSVPITKNYKTVKKLLERLSKKAGMKKYGWRYRSVAIYRLQSLYFMEDLKTHAVIDIIRGNTIVKPSDVTPVRLFNSLKAGARWLAANQREDGSYNYEFFPCSNRSSKSDNIVRQAGTAAFMARAGSFLDDDKITAAAKKSIDFLLRKIEVANNGLHYVKYNDKGKLGSVAFLLWAMVEYKYPEQYMAWIKKITRSIISQQKNDGSLATYFHPPDQKGGEKFYPGEALWALMRTFELTHDQRCVETVKKAFPYYSDYWKGQKATAFVPWQTKAYSALHKVDPCEEYAEFVFSMSDWLLEKQLKIGQVKYPDYAGSFKIARYPQYSTTVFTEGIAAAYQLSKRVGKNTKKYEQSIISAARFILSLQFNQKNSYYLNCEKQRVLGGFRKSIVNNHLRIDVTQHAGCAIIDILEIFKK